LDDFGLYELGYPRAFGRLVSSWAAIGVAASFVLLGRFWFILAVF
jgi:hypothetical protein